MISSRLSCHLKLIRQFASKLLQCNTERPLDKSVSSCTFCCYRSCCWRHEHKSGQALVAVQNLKACPFHGGGSNTNPEVEQPGIVLQALILYSVRPERGEDIHKYHISAILQRQFQHNGNQKTKCIKQAKLDLAIFNKHNYHQKDMFLGALQALIFYIRHESYMLCWKVRN